MTDLARRIWYPIWDAGVPLDHGVKTVTEALGVAARDLKAAMGLLTARCVAGEADLAADLAKRALDQWRTNGKKWLHALGDATRERHARVGDVAFLLEPDLKEGRGGLRDVTALRAAALAAPVLSEEDLFALEASELVVAARVELHRVNGKGEHLVLQAQPAVAHGLGMDNADTLMRAVSGAARTIAFVSDDAWRRVDSFLQRRSRASVRPDHVHSPGVVIRGGEVCVDQAADLDDGSLVLRVAAAAAQGDVPIGRAALEQLRQDAAGPGDPWPPDAPAALFDLLAAGPPAVAVFEALDQYGLLTRILPEWEPVRCKPQHNPYHRFTVDRHLVEAAVEASALRDRVTRPDLLLLGAWLHDLGKGYPGDHSVASADLMHDISTRMGFAAEDQHTLAKLTREHLLLPDTATRRDVRDPATVAKVAEVVEDMTTLELLHALTEADGKATGPSAWSSWKGALVDELVTAVAARLGGAPPIDRRWQLDPGLQALVDEAAGTLLVRPQGSTVVIVSPDRPGLFCKLAGVLCLHGLEVLTADVRSAGGTAVDSFVFHRPAGDGDWDRFRGDLERALGGSLDLDTRIAERAHNYRLQYRGAGPPLPYAVTVDNDASGDATVVEVRGSDALGVLYRIAYAFADLRLDIRHAKVLTLGSEIVDSFYVVDSEGRKIEDAPRVADIQRAVLVELTRLA